MRVSGVEIPANKQIYIALCYVHGIGVYVSRKICDAAGVGYRVKVTDLTSTEISSLINVISDKYVIEGELRRVVTTNIKRKIEMNCYQGRMHRNKLPVRGQKTHSNARTRKGRAKVPVAGKKKAV